jgi:hypothetical protein
VSEKVKPATDEDARNLFGMLNQVYEECLTPIAKTFGFDGPELDDSFVDFMRERATELAELRRVVGPKCEACGQYALEHFQTTGGAMLSRKSPWPNWCPVTPEYESWMASREKR